MAIHCACTVYTTDLCDPVETADRRFAIWVCGALAATPRMWIPFAFCMKSPAFPVGTSVAELFSRTFRLMGRTHELLHKLPDMGPPSISKGRNVCRCRNGHTCGPPCANSDKVCTGADTHRISIEQDEAERTLDVSYQTARAGPRHCRILDHVPAQGLPMELQRR